MKKKTSTLYKRLSAVLLSGALLLSAGALLPAGADNPFSLTAKAEVTAGGNYEYSVQDGEVTITKYAGTGTTAKIPSKVDGMPVTQIGNYAFMNCTEVTSVTIPSSVKSLGQSVFYGCTNLTAVSLPEGLTDIPRLLFYGCSSLAEVTIPDSVCHMGDKVFYGTKWYDDQPDGPVYAGRIFYTYKGTMPNGTSLVIEPGTAGIAANALEDRKELSSLTIPGSVKIIGRMACSECKGLLSLNVPEGVEEIRDSAFFGCTMLSSVTLPNSLKVLQGTTFSTCPSLTSIVIPEGITTVSSVLFANCTSLTSVTLPSSIQEISLYAFMGCKSLESIQLPNGLTKIGPSAFSSCSSLTSLTLPETVTEIGSSAFTYCTELSSITIPASVTTIGSGVFYKCDNVTIYGVPGSAAHTYAVENQIPFVSTAAFQNTSTLSKTTVPKLTVVTVTGASENGTGNVTYAFYYKKSTSKTWTSMGEKFGNTKEVSFIPNMAATYQVMVKAKDETGKVVTKMMELISTKPTADDLVNVSTISKTEAKKGEAIALTGKATGGQGAYTYAFYYKKGTSKTFTPVAEPYSGKTKVYFKPAYATEYTVRILVKDEAGTVAVKEYKVNVTK